MPDSTCPLTARSGPSGGILRGHERSGFHRRYQNLPVWVGRFLLPPLPLVLRASLSLEIAMARTTVALVLALVMVGCEPESRLKWSDPFADSFSVRGYARDQIGLGVNGVGLKLTAPDGAEFVEVTRDVAPGDAGWFAMLFFGPAGEYRLAITSVPAEYSVPATQSNPITFQLSASARWADVAISLHRD
jgi:hypothetical protein